MCCASPAPSGTAVLGSNRPPSLLAMSAPRETTGPATAPLANIRTLADVMEVARTSDTGGVVAREGELISWPEIADRVQRIAAALEATGAARGDRVVVLLPKSVESFVAMHATLRAGLVAVPLNPLATRGAILPTVDAVAPHALITTPALAQRLAEHPDDRANAEKVHVLVVGEADSDNGLRSRFATWRPWAQAVATSVVADGGEMTPEPDDDAYILFTSGSTGRPKGMVHTHRSGLAYAATAVGVHDVDRSTRLAGTAPLHFDMSTLELYSIPLARATALTITEADQRFPATLSERLAETEATHVYAVPSLLHLLAEHGAIAERDLSALRHVAFAGEPMGTALLGRWMDRLPHATFVNAYGPAEVNVVTSHRFDSSWDRQDVPIGRPWPDVQARIVDDALDDVRTGAVGELLVASPSCMRGYWRQDAETDACTTIDVDGTRWYRTGDLVHEIDEVLHFSGRRDNQVKVRGVRIEVEAVERTICAEPSVAQALVTRIVDDGTASLFAWVVPVPDGRVDERRVIRWCRARLAAESVPAGIVVNMR